MYCMLLVLLMASNLLNVLTLRFQLHQFVHLQDTSFLPSCIQNCLLLMVESIPSKLLILSWLWHHSARHPDPRHLCLLDVNVFHILIPHHFHCLTVTMCLENCSRVPTPLSAGWLTVQKYVLLKNWSQQCKIWQSGMKAAVYVIICYYFS